MEKNNDIIKKALEDVIREQRKSEIPIANALVQSKNTIVEYSKEISRKEKELEELQQEAKENPGGDYRTDIKYIKNNIKELKKEKDGVRKDVVNLGNKLQIYDAQIKTIYNSLGRFMEKMCINYIAMA